MLRFFDSAVFKSCLPYRRSRCCLPLDRTRPAHGIGDFGAQYPRLPFLDTDATPALLPMPAYGRSQVGWLDLPCRTLSFPTSNQFIPALSLAPSVTPLVLRLDSFTLPNFSSSISTPVHLPSPKTLGAFPLAKFQPNRMESVRSDRSLVNARKTAADSTPHSARTLLRASCPTPHNQQ